jgi:HD-GYP domain-containing protein (c-di-GMP phosphodiesterase class II)
MGTPDAILHKNGPLDQHEREIIQQHPQHAYDMLKHIEYLQAALEIPYCHHEKWDGTGYPRGLKGEEIPVAARLFAIVDVYDALVSDRPYRKALPHEEVVAYLRSQSGTHFDPAIVNLFLKVLSQS